MNKQWKRRISRAKCRKNDERLGEEMLQRIRDLYWKTGLGHKRVAKVTGLSPRRVKRIVGDDPERQSQAWNKGLKFRVFDANKLIADEYRKELRTMLRFDEEHHWYNHPAIAVWQSWKAWNALTPEQRRQKSVSRRLRRTNYWLSKVLRSRVYRVLKGDLKSAPTLTLLGCSIEYLKRYIERLFLPGMSWDNYGVHGWHIDHKRPCCTFDLSKPEEQRACFHYTNLQPLWAKDNWTKPRTFTPCLSV